ncbi:MAG: hypothetical protein ACRC9Q_10020 [Bacteroidales bacterium]
MGFSQILPREHPFRFSSSYLCEMPSGSGLSPGPTIRQVVPDSFLQESLFIEVRGCFSNNWWLKTTE